MTDFRRGNCNYPDLLEEIAFLYWQDFTLSLNSASYWYPVAPQVQSWETPWLGGVRGNCFEKVQFFPELIFMGYRGLAKT